MKQIADTGLIVGLPTRNDPHHRWAAAAFRHWAPFYVCEPVLTEAASFFPDPVGILTLLARGDQLLEPGFTVAGELARIRELCLKYADRPMDLADACVVRLSELNPRCLVWTVDRAEFSIYRRKGRQLVPCEFPPA